MLRALQRLRNEHRALQALQASDRAIPRSGGDADAACRPRERGQLYELPQVLDNRQSLRNDASAVGTPAEPMTVNAHEDDAEVAMFQAVDGRTRRSRNVPGARPAAQPPGDTFMPMETCEFSGGMFRPLRSEGPWIALECPDSHSESEESQHNLDDVDYDHALDAEEDS